MNADAQPVPWLGRQLILAVTGSIAAYKAVSLLRSCTRQGASVSVVMTASATKFVTPMTFEVLSGRRVTTDLFEAHEEMKHLSIPEGADAIVVAPATANFLAKAAVGLADDVLSTMLLTTRCPLIVAPAMDGDMWSHPTVQEHVHTLRSRGVIVLDPEEGPLASGMIAQGRLASEPRILEAIDHALMPVRDLKGHRILVSAGPTQEPIDPVRYISNRSSGKMGYALAEAARQRGAQVTLVTGPTALTPLPGIRTIPVTTAQEMATAMADQFGWATIVIMAAAVADFRPKSPAPHKIKKGTQPVGAIELESAPDILSMLSARRTSQLLVGFAAETQHLLPHAQTKLAAKGLDLIVANDVTQAGAGFGSDQNAAVVLTRTGVSRTFDLRPKAQLAHDILTAIVEFSQQVPRTHNQASVS
ncbi:MAG: bifunctional phosphopantothenoylcysteine decarboxylase/phosphopantothenate--cysteine ligase CoaBC [Nitrospira sp.]